MDFYLKVHLTHLTVHLTGRIKFVFLLITFNLQKKEHMFENTLTTRFKCIMIYMSTNRTCVRNNAKLEIVPWQYVCHS